MESYDNFNIKNVVYKSKFPNYLTTEKQLIIAPNYNSLFVVIIVIAIYKLNMDIMT